MPEESNITPPPSAVLENLANEIIAATVEAKKASKASLTHYKAVGEKLNEAKDLLGYGKFGPWAEKKGFKPEWRRRLMSLAENWSVVEAYLDEGGGSGFGYSVKAACKIIDRHLGRGAASKVGKQQPDCEQKKFAPEPSENSSAEHACRNRADATVSADEQQTESDEDSPPDAHEQQPPKFPTLVEENLRLSAELKEAYARIARLIIEKDTLEKQIVALQEGKILPGGILEQAAATTPNLHS